MKIAAGVGKNREVIKAAERVDFEVIPTSSEDELVNLLFKGNVDAAIRGSLNATKIIPLLKRKYPKISRASCIDLNGKRFLLGPVGIDEGDSLDQKIQLAVQGSEFMESIGIKPKIAVLSGGRPNDRGRSSKIDASLEQGELLTENLKERLLNAEHYHILIEDAVKGGANFIIAPDGISGNLIFRTIAFLGCGKSHGAVTLGINEIYIDTSRSQDLEGYTRALNFAKFLAEARKHLDINR